VAGFVSVAAFAQVGAALIVGDFAADDFYLVVAGVLKHRSVVRKLN
jgi:hypothetical protein